MREQGFVVGAYNVSTFYHRQRGLRVMVHGDDFISTGKGIFVLDETLIGHRKGEAPEGRVLNRVIRACSAGWEYEGDQRHAELVVGAMDLKISEHSHHQTRGRCEEGEGGGGESAVGGEQDHNVQAASRPRKLHGDGQGRHPVCRQGDMSFNGESDNWQLAAAKKVSKMFEEAASGSGEV